VLRIIARLNVGGPAIHVGLLTARLDPARFESLLAAGTPGAAEGSMFDLRPSLAAEVGDRLVTVPGLGRDVSGAGDVRATIALTQLVRRFRPHIIHTHTAKAGAIGRVIGRALRAPVLVHTFHGTVFAGHFPRPVGAALVAGERVLGAMADAVLAVSPAVAADLQARRIARRRLRVLPLGLDLDALFSVPPAAHDAPAVVTLLARLVPVKDVPLFLRAAEVVREHRPEVEFRIAGDGPLRAELEAAAPRWARFLGFAGDLPALLADTTVVALSSRSEGSPVALIEALAAGRPVAAVPVGGVPDVLGGRPGAILAADRSPEGLGAAILEALGDVRHLEAAERGRADVVATYGIGRLVSDIEALYDELWAARRRGR
jgi:glycosyltransferase involved in cell wall biosynthesis